MGIGSTMHVALIGTYPPTVCGIATFTADVEASLRGEGHQVTVIPVAREIPVARDGSSCPIALTRDERASYTGAAARVNQSGFDVVVVQHEFGIFGGAAGAYIADFVEALQVPVVLTLHTVLARHTWRQRQVLRRLLRRVAAVTVFTTTARQLLIEMQLFKAMKAKRALAMAPAPSARNAAKDKIVRSLKTKKK